MDEVKEKKKKIRAEITKTIETMPEEELEKRARIIEERLFDFANFLESKVPLLYMSQGIEMPTGNIILRCFAENRVVVLPTFEEKKYTMTLYKIDDFDADLVDGPRKVKEPDPARCKRVPLDKVDIAIIPGYAFDEKGGRIGSGLGYYDRIIPKLPLTTRKVALTLEAQIVPQIPTESHDKHVDIIITDERVIYKI